MLFLGRIHDLFHLWHVVHRPFAGRFVDDGVELVPRHQGAVFPLLGGQAAPPERHAAGQGQGGAHAD